MTKTTTENVKNFIEQNCWYFDNEDPCNTNDAKKILKRHGYYIGTSKCGGWDAIA